jgi:hypothetical protein
MPITLLLDGSSITPLVIKEYSNASADIAFLLLQEMFPQGKTSIAFLVETTTTFGQGIKAARLTLILAT